MSEPAVLLRTEGPVTVLELNRPHRINAVSMAMRDELFEALCAFNDDPLARVAVLFGRGEGGFCAGADLVEFGTAPSLVEAHRSRTRRDLWGLMASIRKPLVAALHGYVIGAGVEIACLCDMRIASARTVFAMPEVTIGMIPGAGGTQTLPRTIGVGRAMARFLAARGDRMSAAEAASCGLVHRVVPGPDLGDEAMSVARTLSARRPVVARALKTAVLDGLDVSLEQGLDLERRLAAGL